MNYYCFVAGSKDLVLDTPKGCPEMEDLLEEYKSILSNGDAKLVRILRLAYDNQNFLTLIKDKDAEVNPLGNFSKERWLEALDFMGDMEPKDIYKEYGIDAYFTECYQEIHSEEFIAKGVFPENLLNTKYYNYGLKSKNKFLKQWFEFNLNLKNVTTALICKKNDFDISNNLVGDNEIIETIRNNYSSKDLGLNGIYENIDAIISIYDNPVMVEQERKTDALKWNFLEENTFFTPFSIEQLLAYWLKCELLNRWNILSAEKGKEVFAKILADLKKDIKI